MFSSPDESNEDKNKDKGNSFNLESSLDDSISSKDDASLGDSNNPATLSVYDVDHDNDQKEKWCILDRTGQNIGDPMSELEDLDPSLLEVDYTNTRLRKLPPLKNLFQVERVNLRQNLLDYMDLQDLQHLTTMKHLDLYDNRLTSAKLGLERCTNLTNLDISYNLIKRMENINTLVNIKDLWYANNLVRHIQPGLEMCTSLRTLELGANRIRKIENLDGLTSLENLWLGKNRISCIQGLDNLINLKRLDLQANRITKIEALSNLVLLEELYLAHNRISKIEKLNQLTRLNILDLSSNRIEHLENLSESTQLTDLWLNHNLISSFQELSELQNITQLSTLYLESNPLAKDLQYRVKVFLALPLLKQLDATPISYPGYSIVHDSVQHTLKGVLKKNASVN